MPWTLLYHDKNVKNAVWIFLYYFQRKKMEACYSFLIGVFTLKIKIVCVTAKQKKYLRKFEPANRKNLKAGLLSKNKK